MRNHVTCQIPRRQACIPLTIVDAGFACQVAEHAQVEAGNYIRGARFLCGACGEPTGLCARFKDCRGAAKAAGPIFDPLCMQCLSGIARSIPGNELLGEFGQRIGSPLQTLLSKEQADRAVNFLRGKGEEIGRNISGKTDAIRSELQSKAKEIGTNLAILNHSRPGEAEGPGEAAACNAGEDSPRKEKKGRRRIDLSAVPGFEAIQKEGSHRRVLAEDNSVPGGGEDEDEEGREDEDWRTVRDALLTWQGGEREYVDRWRPHICRKNFVGRWVSSAKGDLEVATRRLLKHLKWRCEWGLDEIADADWAKEDARGELYVGGVDREGRGTMTWKLGEFKAKGRTPREIVGYLVYVMERTWAVTPLADHMNVILDCQGIGLDTYDHGTVILAVEVLSSNYPDNLKVVIVFPVGWVVSSILAIFTPLLSKETVAKGKLLQEHEVHAGLLALFDPDEIETRFGGFLNLEAAAKVSRI